MDTSPIVREVDSLIERINSIDSISAKGLQNQRFPDEVIASLHDHLGNCKHYISDVDSAFNASEQFTSIKSGINELEDATEDIRKLHDKLTFSDYEFRAIIDMMHDLEEKLKTMTDPEYT